MYTAENFDLIYAQDNVQNYVLLRRKDFSEVLVFDWDLSEDEIASIVEKFNMGTLDLSDFANTEWQPLTQLDTYISFKVLA